MKSLQKLILPILFLAIIFIIYKFYFGSAGLGSFADFDPNNNASKDIVVEFVKEKGVQNDAQAGASIFYAKDKEGQEVMIQGPLPLPEGFENSAAIKLTGHLHKEFFHAHEVTIQ